MKLQALLALALVALVPGCIFRMTGEKGSGVIKTDVRTTEAFEEIELSGVTTVNYRIGPAAPIAITCDDNLLPLVETKVSGKKLTISTSKSISTTQGLKIEITMPALAKVSMSGACTLDAGGWNGGALDVEMSGACRTTLRGKVDALKLEMSGAGEVQALDLEATHGRIEISGAGKAYVHAEKTLDVEVSGAAKVAYDGGALVHQSISGAGSVERILGKTK